VIANAKRRGRPRSEAAQKAILDAAARLLVERGLDTVSMDAVADLAGVSKATIYRWWPSKQSLALDALLAEWEAVRPRPRNTGSLRGDLLSVLRPWVKLVSGRPYARLIAMLIAEVHCDPHFAQLWRDRFVPVRREPVRLIFARAIERGEIPVDTDVELALDLIYGPLYHRLLHGHAPVNDRVAVDVVDAALTGVAR
jgi:AcrR family transcriptional regulator